MKKFLLKASSFIISATMLMSIAAYAESQVYVQEEANAVVEGQYFEKSDPLGLGNLTKEDIQAGLEKSNHSLKVTAIRQKSLKDPSSVTKADIQVVQEYIDKYNGDATVRDLIGISATGISPSAIGDYQSKNLNLPGIKQDYDNYCAPASIQAVLAGKGISASQATLANSNHCNIVPNGVGTLLGRVAPSLNRYNKANEGSNLNFTYYTLLPSSVPASEWNVRMSDNAIETIVGNYGVIYDVHQVKGSPNYLSGYSTMTADYIFHYVAGEGFDASDPANRICYYYDSNNLKTNLGNRHMNIMFRTMGVLTNDMGLVY